MEYDGGRYHDFVCVPVNHCVFVNIVIVESGIVFKSGPKVSDIETFMCNCASTNVLYVISYN